MSSSLIPVIAAALALSVGISVYKAMVRKRLGTYLMKKDTAGFSRAMSRAQIGFLFSPFEIDYMNLKAAVCSGSRADADALFQKMLNRNLNRSQQILLNGDGFNYYFEQEDYPRAKEFLDRLQKISSSEVYEGFDRTYDTFALKGWKYLDRETARLKRISNPAEKAAEMYLIAQMYENKGDLDQRDYWRGCMDALK